MNEPSRLLALAGRGELPFELLHGEPLYLHALRALNEALTGSCLVSAPRAHVERVVAEVRSAGLSAEVSADDEWWHRVATDTDRVRELLVHDPLCPLTSPEFLRAVALGGERDGARVAFRPVTDTVKRVVDGRIVGTIDREGLAALTSPMLLPAAMLQQAIVAGTMPPLDDLAELVTWARARGEVELVKAPSLARRVDDPSAVNLLECVDEMTRRTRT